MMHLCDAFMCCLTVLPDTCSFSGIKGVQYSGGEDVAFERLLREIDLDDKADEHTENLSGGQKRKLSVGIALIGEAPALWLWLWLCVCMCVCLCMYVWVCVYVCVCVCVCVCRPNLE